MSLSRYIAALVSGAGSLTPGSAQIVLSGNVPVFSRVNYLQPDSAQIIITGNSGISITSTWPPVQIFITL